MTWNNIIDNIDQTKSDKDSSAKYVPLSLTCDMIHNVTEFNHCQTCMLKLYMFRASLTKFHLRTLPLKL